MKKTENREVKSDVFSMLLSECDVLREYMQFIECIREQEAQGSKEPIGDAIKICIRNDVLREFLESRKEEVLKAMIIDMTFERREELIRRDERAEGIEEGIKKGIEKGRRLLLISQVNDGEISVERAAEYMNMSIEEFSKLLQ